MSTQQILINRYIGGLDAQTSVKVQLHFLLNESDDSARQMLITNLKKKADETSNTKLMSIINSVEKGINKIGEYGEFAKEFEKKNKEEKMEPPLNIIFAHQQARDYQGKAQRAFTSFHLENALKYYEKAITKDESYFDYRAEIHLLRNRYLAAYQCALGDDLRPGNYPIQFCAAVAMGNFELAYKLVSGVKDHIGSSQITVISRNELYQLLFLVVLSQANIREIISFYEFLRSTYEGYDLMGLCSQIVSLLRDRNFKELLDVIHTDVVSVLTCSIYTDVVCPAFIYTIRANMIANLVEPYAKIGFPEIMRQCRCSRDELILFMRPMIRNAKINGKIDLINDEYIGGGVVGEEREMKQLLYRTIVIKEQLNTVLFQISYNQTKKKPK